MFSSIDLPSSLSLSNDGVLSVREDIDRESNNQITFTVIATDGDSMNNHVDVVLEVLDVNDNTPLFVSSSKDGLLLENQPPGTVVMVVMAIDQDSGSNSIISYSLVGNNELLYFSISPDGEILSNYPIDYEEIKSVSLTVRASDNGIHRRHADMSVLITIGNVPDGIPVFTDSYYSLTLDQATPINTPLLTLRAIAEDNVTSIRYMLNHTNQFMINEASGVLSTVASISPDTVNMSLTVVAVNGDTSTSVPVFVSVQSHIPCEVHPKLFVVAEFSVFLLSPFPLGDLAFTPQWGSGNGGVGVSLEPSRHRSEEHFMLTGNTLMMLPSVTSGVHKLSVSVDTNAGGKWFDEVEIRVALLSNASLEHHVAFLLPNLHPNDVSSHFLNTFLQAVSTRITCSTNQLQVVSVQGTDKGTELVLVVLQPDLISPMPKEQYINELILHIGLIQDDVKWSVVILNVNICRGMSCDHYQQCTTSLVLYSPRHNINTGSLSIFSMLFGVQPSCVCLEGFNANCSQQIDHCNPNPCHFNGICHNLVGGYECECPAYTSGRNCTVVCPSSSCELCDTNPCYHGATCIVQLDGKQLCSGCPDGFNKDGLCEMATSSFYGDGFIEYPVSPFKTHLSINLLFATVTPNGRLMYIGMA